MTAALRIDRAAWLAILGVLMALQPSVASAEDKLVKSFGAGTGASNVGISVSDDGPDKEEDGPQALAVGGDGTLFMLDQINGRILSFDPKAPTKPSQAYELPPGIQASDLVVKGSDIYVWDGKVHALQTLGPSDAPTRGLSETRSAEPVDDETVTAFRQMGSAEIGDDGPTRGLNGDDRNDLAVQAVETKGRGPVVVRVTLTDNGAGAVLDVRSKIQSNMSAQLHVRVHDRLGTIGFLDIDQTGHLYVLAENIPSSINEAAFAFVARFSPAGVFEGVYELPLSSTTISRRCITVARDGVFFLRTLKSSTDVVELGFRAMPNAAVAVPARYRPNLAAASFIDSSHIGVAVGPLTRQKILDAARAYEGIQWTVSPPNYGPSQVCSGFNGRIRVPMYMIGKQGESVRGVPYCWGCQGSVRQFVDRVRRGTLAGNVCTKDGVRGDAAGVDCSSFVSATWGLSTHFTTAVIPTIARRLANPWDLLPGDALDKPGSHVVLFMGFTPNREAMVMEASPGACKGRVCRNVYPLSWLLSRGFVPVRYRALADESAAR